MFDLEIELAWLRYCVEILSCADIIHALEHVTLLRPIDCGIAACLDHVTDSKGSIAGAWLNCEQFVDVGILCVATLNCACQMLGEHLKLVAFLCALTPFTLY